MRFFVKTLTFLGGCAIFPWFFTHELGQWAFWIAGAGYLLILISNGVSSREGWRWEFTLHALLAIGIALIILPLYLKIEGGLKIICFAAGFTLVLAIGYNARMRLIGQGDPAWELWVEIREKLIKKRE